jgi:hypothetical protein
MYILCRFAHKKSNKRFFHFLNLPMIYNGFLKLHTIFYIKK